MADDGRIQEHAPKSLRDVGEHVVVRSCSRSASSSGDGGSAMSVQVDATMADALHEFKRAQGHDSHVIGHKTMRDVETSAGTVATDVMMKDLSAVFDPPPDSILYRLGQQKHRK